MPRRAPDPTPHAAKVNLIFGELFIMCRRLSLSWFDTHAASLSLCQSCRKEIADAAATVAESLSTPTQNFVIICAMAFANSLHIKAFRVLSLIVSSFILAVPVPAQTDQAKLHFKIAEAAMKNGDLAAAEQELAQAVEFDPKNGVLWYNLADVQFKEKKFFVAKNTLEVVDRLDTRAVADAVLDLKAAIAYATRNRTDLAIFAGAWGAQHRDSRDYIGETTCNNTWTDGTRLDIESTTDDSGEIRGKLKVFKIVNKDTCAHVIGSGLHGTAFDGSFRIVGKWSEDSKAIDFQATGSSTRADTNYDGNLLDVANSWAGSLILDGDELVIRTTGLKAAGIKRLHRIDGK